VNRKKPPHHVPYWQWAMSSPVTTPQKDSRNVLFFGTGKGILSRGNNMSDGTVVALAVSSGKGVTWGNRIRRQVEGGF
jgi:hypothetical protein